MSGAEEKSRTDSVTDQHEHPISAQLKPIQTAVSKKAAYSLYPSSSSTPTSPRSREQMSLDSRRPKIVTRDTAWRVPSSQSPSPSKAARTNEAEPLFEDFHARLTSSPSSKPGIPRMNSLPGLDLDVPRVATTNQDADGAAPAPPDLTMPRPVKPAAQSASSDPDSRQARSDTDELAVSNSSSPEKKYDSARQSLSYGFMSSSDPEETHQLQRQPSLAPLQSHGLRDTPDQMETIHVDDPRNFDLIVGPPENNTGQYQLEALADRLFSEEHLQQIFVDPSLLLHFSGFLNSHRPNSVRLLMYYLDASKALHAIRYANGITEALTRLRGYDFSNAPPPATVNRALEKRAAEAFDVLVREELPAYITYTWIQVVHDTMQRLITGTLAPHLREAAEGLAEVFCLSDPSRHDNPIVFASEEFQRTTQYGMSYAVGRNCRFLQGPRTNPHSVRRLAEAVRAGQEHSEVFLNYRRDGSPFMNLLMIAPLHDSQGKVRYYIGAQVDVSNLASDATDLDGFSRLLNRDRDPAYAAEIDELGKKEAFEALSEMLNTQELSTIRRHGGRMHRAHADDDSDRHSIVSNRPRLVFTDPTSEVMDANTASLPRGQKEQIRSDGRLQGPYQHYLLLRPYPSLRILFTSPSLRIPGMLQSPFLSRVGGSSRVRTGLSQAFAEGRGVTANIRWMTKLDPDGVGEGEGRSRWIHATPLLNHRGEIGVWMVVLVDADTRQGQGRRQFRDPPVVLDPRLAPATAGKGKSRPKEGRFTIGGTPVGQRYEVNGPHVTWRGDALEKGPGMRQFVDSEDEEPGSGRSDLSAGNAR